MEVRTGRARLAWLSVPGSLTRGVHLAFAALVATSAARYLTHHGLDGRWWLVIVLVAVVAAAYAALVVLARRPRPTARRVVLGVLLLAWGVLVLVAPSFAWSAIPLFFVCRTLVPAPAAHVLVGAVAVVTGVALFGLSGRSDWAAAVAPLVVAVLLSLAYDAIVRQAGERVRLQREVAVLAERERMAREIHDTVAQSLSSAVLRLEAADQRWDAEPGAARDDARQAAVAVRASLGQTRDLVHDLVDPSPAAGGVAPADLGAAIRTAARRHVPAAELTVVGDPVPVGAETAHALARIAQSAVANVHRHAGPARLGLTLTYLPEAVALDVFDDGRGFDVAGVASRAVGPDGGFGLRAMRQRVEQLGGTITVESGPGEGTVVGVQLPVPGTTSPPRHGTKEDA
ncbi:Signal transduction histidine kinase [Krasilnikoviella flava]|uniref:Oxygen sensor histidine kinase NreB n=1 Tax=Krasilnikoviella flava TaxID=526729 RepID=A0A1T5KVG9_9MICO|nr:Signal transduction histidine kinase [Krasilnikoviella flava]